MKFARLVFPLGGPLVWLLLSLGSPAEAQEPRVKIGFLVKNPEENWFQKEWQFATLAGRDLGFEVIKIGVTDGEKTLAAIDVLGAKGAQGFVICAPDPKLGPAILAKASAYHMKVIAVDDQLSGPDGRPFLSVPYLGISAREIGNTVGSVCWTEMNRRGWDRADTGAIAVSYRELETAVERVDGASSTLAHSGFPLTNIFDAPQKTTDVEGGFTAALAAVTKKPGIKHWLVYGINDETVLGEVQALEGLGFSPRDIIGVGINGMALAVSELKKNTVSGFFASILLDARRHGYETSSMLFHWIVYNQAPPLDTRTTGTVITRANYVAVLRSKGLGDLLP